MPFFHYKLQNCTFRQNESFFTATYFILLSSTIKILNFLLSLLDLLFFFLVNITRNLFFSGKTISSFKINSKIKITTFPTTLFLHLFYYLVFLKFDLILINLNLYHQIFYLWIHLLEQMIGIFCLNYDFEFNTCINY